MGVHHKGVHSQIALLIAGMVITKQNYRKTFSLRRTKSPNFFRLVLQLSLPNPLKLDVKSRMKMQLEQRRQAMLLLQLSDQQVYRLLRCVLY